MAHILVTTDFSPAAAHAYAHALRQARTEADRITLCHVVVDVKTAPQGAPLAPPQSAPGLSAEIEAAEQQLQEIAKGLAGAPVTCLVLTGTNVAEAITAHASPAEADLIVTATHGRSGIRHLVLGSVAESIVRHSRVPVLCVPASADA